MSIERSNHRGIAWWKVSQTLTYLNAAALIYMAYVLVSYERPFYPVASAATASMILSVGMIVTTTLHVRQVAKTVNLCQAVALHSARLLALVMQLAYSRWSGDSDVKQTSRRENPRV